MLTRKRILEAVAKGEYEVKIQHDCDCYAEKNEAGEYFVNSEFCSIYTIMIIDGQEVFFDDGEDNHLNVMYKYQEILSVRDLYHICDIAAVRGSMALPEEKHTKEEIEEMIQETKEREIAGTNTHEHRFIDFLNKKGHWSKDN